MNRVKRIFTDYQLPMFFLLTYLLSWWSAPFVQGGIFPFGPALAAWIVLAGSTDWHEWKNLKRRITRWRVAWVFNRSTGSVLVIMVLHFFSNFIGLVFYPVFAGNARANYYAVFMGLESLIALWIVWKFRLGLEMNYSVD